MAHKINFEALRLAAATAIDIYMEFSAPYTTYLKRARTHDDVECDVCLKKALAAMRKLEKAAGVVIVADDISWLEMAEVCTEIDYQASLLCQARSQQ